MHHAKTWRRKILENIKETPELTGGKKEEKRRGKKHVLGIWLIRSRPGRRHETASHVIHEQDARFPRIPGEPCARRSVADVIRCRESCQRAFDWSNECRA